MTGTSIIIPAYRAERTLPYVLEALEPEVKAGGREVVLVLSGGGEPGADDAPWLRVMSFSERILPGRARNLGVSQTTGSLVAFLDADAVPQPGWLDELERAMTPGIDAVAGAVLDGTPDKAWGTAGYLLEFQEWAPNRRGVPPHAVACNLLIRRSAFERAGGFPEELWPAEDAVLTIPFAARGALAFAPGAQVTHLNRITARDVLAHQRRLGSSWAQASARVPLRGHRLAVPGLAPVAVAARGCSMIWHRPRHPGSLRQLARHSPLLAAGLVAWGVGVWRARGAARTQPSVSSK